MMTSIVPSIELSENHRRSISITLQLVDKALCEWEDWANGRVRSGIMYREKDTFSSTQKIEMRNRIAKIRQSLVRLRDDLQLLTNVVATSQSVIGQAAVLWEILTEFNGHGLQGYGKVAENLAPYLDPIGETLCEEMHAIARLFSQPGSDEPKPDALKLN
jgi:hypothetical protein